MKIYEEWMCSIATLLALYTWVKSAEYPLHCGLGRTAGLDLMDSRKALSQPRMRLVICGRSACSLDFIPNGLLCH
jgi:hypothetical protein